MGAKRSVTDRSGSWTVLVVDGSAMVCAKHPVAGRSGVPAALGIVCSSWIVSDGSAIVGVVHTVIDRSGACTPAGVGSSWSVFDDSAIVDDRRTVTDRSSAQDPAEAGTVLVVAGIARSAAGTTNTSARSVTGTAITSARSVAGAANTSARPGSSICWAAVCRLLGLPVWGRGNSTPSRARHVCSRCHCWRLRSPLLVGNVSWHSPHLNANTAGPAVRTPCGVGKEHECPVGLKPIAELHLQHILAVARILMLWTLSRWRSSDLLVAVQLAALNVALHFDLSPRGREQDEEKAGCSEKNSSGVAKRPRSVRSYTAGQINLSQLYVTVTDTVQEYFL
jgi:hypothetical protein